MVLEVLVLFDREFGQLFFMREVIGGQVERKMLSLRVSLLLKAFDKG